MDMTKEICMLTFTQRMTTSVGLYQHPKSVSFVVPANIEFSGHLMVMLKLLLQYLNVLLLDIAKQ